MSVLLQLELLNGLLQEAPRVVALVLLSAVVSAAAALVHRWYTRERVPGWLAALFGGSAVAFYLNAVGLFETATSADPAAVFDPVVVLSNSAILVGAVAISPAGAAVGDRIATDVFAVAGARSVDAEVSRIVRTVGRVTTVELPADPDDIGDMEGYDPVQAARKEAMAGKRLLFPRRLRTEELTDRLVTRIKEDYGVGHVDVELDDDGEVSYLAVGRRAAGLGPTLAPGAAAVAVRADPGAGASAGDAVQLWRRGADGNAERVASGELRATADDVATVILDEAEAERLDRDASYRLLTLPADPGAEREFTSLLRTADETMETVTVEPGSDLVGATVGGLDVTVVAVRPPDGGVEAIPRRGRELAAGDVLFLVARPETIRGVARTATAPGGTTGAEGRTGESPQSTDADADDDD